MRTSSESVNAKNLSTRGGGVANAKQKYPLRWIQLALDPLGLNISRIRYLEMHAFVVKTTIEGF